MAAITRDDFFAQKQKGALWDVGVSINRTNPLPLDKNAVFASEEELDTYIGGVLAYPGQPVAVVTTTGTKLYVLGYDENGILAKQAVGEPTSGDGKSITLSDDGILSIAGFDETKTGHSPQIQDGKITWVEVASQADYTTVKNSIADINETIENWGTVLNYIGSTTSEEFITDTGGAYDASNYEEGNVILITDTGKEYVCVKKGEKKTWEPFGDATGISALQAKTDELSKSLGTSKDDANSGGTAYARIAENAADISAAHQLISEVRKDLGDMSDGAAKTDNYSSATAFSRIAYLKNKVDDADTGLAATRELAQKGVDDAASAANAAKGAQDTADLAMPKAGGQFTGDVSYSKLPTSYSDNSLIPKKYVDTQLGNYVTTTALDTQVKSINSSITSVKATAEAAMPKTGNESFTGKVSYSSAVTSFDTNDTRVLVTKGYVDTAISNQNISTTYATKEELSDEVEGLENKIKTAQDKADAAATQDNFNKLELRVTAVEGNDGIAGLKTGLSQEISDRQAAISSQAAATLSAAKEYTDNKNTAMDLRVVAVEDKLKNVSKVMDFIGVSTTDPTTEVTINETKITEFQEGDVVLYKDNGKEYVWDGTSWEEFGDVSSQNSALERIDERLSAVEKKIGTPGEGQSENTIYELITTNATAISAETSRATNAEGTLQSSINNLIDQLTWVTF